MSNAPEACPNCGNREDFYRDCQGRWIHPECGNMGNGMNSEDVKNLEKRIVGKRVISVEGSRLLLDDGTVLSLYMSDGDCCAYANGAWLINPDKLEAVITHADFKLLEDREFNGDGSTSHAQITILHNQNPLALADCYADDGNGGYYFSVLSLNVIVPDVERFDIEVVSA